MAKKFILSDDSEKFNFILIGIVCQQKDFRLCRELNLKLAVDMARKDDYTIFSNKRMEEQAFTFFEFTSGDDDQYCLIANKSKQGYLIPEHKQTDFFLVVRPGKMQPDEEGLLSSVREISHVLTAYLLEAEKLRSGENLVF